MKLVRDMHVGIVRAIAIRLENVHRVRQIRRLVRRQQQVEQELLSNSFRSKQIQTKQNRAELKTPPYYYSPGRIGNLIGHVIMKT